MADVSWYVYPQVVLWSWSGVLLLYATPGPSQVTWFPSPMSQTTETGVAVAVAVMPSAVALLVIGVQSAGSIHSQLSRLTMAFPPDGAVETVGAGRFRSASAVWATWPGVGSAGGCGHPSASPSATSS